MHRIATDFANGKYTLKAPFTRCPVCGGTTTMASSIIDGGRRCYSICYSCDTRWDLHGNCIQEGDVLHLPLVNNLTLTEDDAKYNPSIKCGRHRKESR